MQSLFYGKTVNQGMSWNFEFQTLLINYVLLQVSESLILLTQKKPDPVLLFRQNSKFIKQCLNSDMQ